MVNFSSSALDAERVLEAICKSGGKAMTEHCERGRTGKVGRGNEEGIRPDQHPRQQRGYVIVALTVTAADFHRHFDFNVLGLSSIKPDDSRNQMDSNKEASGGLVVACGDSAESI